MKAQVFMRTLPNTSEFQTINEKLCDRGPCRTPTCSDLTPDRYPLPQQLTGPKQEMS